MTNERGDDDIISSALNAAEIEQECGDAIVWVNGMVSILSHEGLMEGKGELTDKGRAAFRALRKRGFVPVKGAALAILDDNTGNREQSERIFAEMMKEHEYPDEDRNLDGTAGPSFMDNDTDDPQNWPNDDTPEDGERVRQWNEQHPDDPRIKGQHPDEISWTTVPDKATCKKCGATLVHKIAAKHAVYKCPKGCTAEEASEVIYERREL